jgi:hypothetical protein
MLEEERSLHCASAKDADAPVGMTDFGGDASDHFAREEFGDGGVPAGAGAALELTEGEERSLHCAPTKGIGAPVGMTDRGEERSPAVGVGTGVTLAA